MADVAIIGGGIAGLSLAWRLAQGGARVVVADMTDRVGRASPAAAGMLAPEAEFGAGASPLVRFARSARAAWPGFAAELEAASGCDVGFDTCGSLHVALRDAEVTRLASEGGAGLLSGDEVRAREPALSRAVLAARFEPGDALVNNVAVLEALEIACGRAGVRLLRAGAPAALLADGAAARGLSCGGQEIAAGAVVIAAGAWSGHVPGVPGAARIALRPVKGQMIACAPAATALRHMLHAGPGYAVARKGLPPAIGATVEDCGFDAAQDPAALAAHEAAMRIAAPEAFGPVIARWSGFRPATPDGWPVLGASRLPGLFYASGQYRNGVLFAPLIAAALLAALHDGALPAAAEPFAATRPAVVP